MWDAQARRDTVVVLPEEIDLINATHVGEQLTLTVSNGATTIADMTRTTFCDCAGARAIVRAHRSATDSGAELCLVVAEDPVRRVLCLLRIDRLLATYPSVAAARARPGPIATN
jgi:anti-anti-sigma factor